ncbi:MAG: spermidine synthase [Puniceicoccaceae bacterium]|nr:MAG: spermidine synthase [Puniceicoccaceae bacterium]
MVLRRRYRWLLVLAACGGAAALGHQLLWTRRLLDLLGAGSEASARVFGCFFLGLALGAAVGEILARRVRRPWRLLAVAEAGIALLSVPALLLPAWTGWIWPALGPEGLLSAAGPVLKFLLSFAVIFPPAFVMGWFLPLAAPAILRGPLELGRHGLMLYACNTLGGVLGLAVVALLALQWFGAQGAMLTVMAVNLCVAVGLWRLDRGPEQPAANLPAAREDARRDRGPPSPTLRAPLLLSAFSGFAILAAEVAALELVMLVAPLSFYAPAAILITVILLLGAAAAVTPLLERKFGGAERLLPTILILSGVATAAAPLLFFALALHGPGLPPAATLTQFLANLLVFCLLCLGPGLFLAGLVFPLTTAWLGTHRGNRSGRSWGWLLAVNGAGGWLGAELAYRLFLPAFGIHLTLGGVGLLYVLAGAAVYAAQSRPRRTSDGALALGGGLVVLLLLTVWLRGLPVTNPHQNFTILREQTGREGTIAVVEHPQLGRAILVSNQYILGSTQVHHDQARQAHLPLLLHPAPREAAFIGVATGITPGAALDHAGVDSITAVELSGNVLAAARDFFDDHNRGVVGHPRAVAVREDGRTWFAAARGRYDVVVGDLFLPWGPGEARLYSVEHFMNVRRSLRSGGIFCQWLAMYQLTPEQFEIIAATFREVFPETHLFAGGFRHQSPILALVGFADTPLDWDVVADRCREERAAGGVRDLLMRHPEGLATLYLGPLRSEDLAPVGPLNTLGNLRVELDAGRERVTGNPGAKYFYGSRWLEFAGRRESLLGETGLLPDHLAPHPRAGRLLMEADLAWHRELPQTADLLREAFRILPATMLRDPAADRDTWPGKPALP